MPGKDEGLWLPSESTCSQTGCSLPVVVLCPSCASSSVDLPCFTSLSCCVHRRVLPCLRASCPMAACLRLGRAAPSHPPLLQRSGRRRAAPTCSKWRHGPLPGGQVRAQGRLLGRLCSFGEHHQLLAVGPHADLARLQYRGDHGPPAQPSLLLSPAPPPASQPPVLWWYPSLTRRSCHRGQVCGRRRRCPVPPGWQGWTGWSWICIWAARGAETTHVQRWVDGWAGG